MAPSRDGDRERRIDSPRRALLKTIGLTVGAAGAGSLSASGQPDGASSQGAPSKHAHSPPPGPEVLYDSPASAPQFENGGEWSADPLLVCGADAYVDGEYLFQDFVYDDKGANTTVDNGPPDPAPDHHDFGPMTGDVVYPTDVETYRNNAADLLEFRARPTKDGVVYRITLNAMSVPDAAVVAVGIDTDRDASTGRDDWGYGVGTLGPLGLDHVLVTWGTGAELDGEPVPSSVDLERNQIEVEVPLDPAGETWRHYLVTGLWNSDANAFEQIREFPDETSPGGAHGTDAPPVFNVGFRENGQEPIATPNVESDVADQLGEAIEERTGSRGIGYGHWREHAQANALAERDISKFHADVDFGKLDDRVTSYNVPRTGYINRLYASRFDLGEGIGSYPDSNGEQVLLGRVQPYSLYVPDGNADGEPRPLHVHLHSLSGTYNQYASWTPDFLRQIGEQRNAFVLTTTGRGPGVPYRDQAELDLFEAWADVRARYPVDADRVTIGGYSMGGIGTHQIASKYPDLFAKAFPIVGSIGGENTDQVAGDDLYTNNELVAINQRHVPLFMWQGTSDELVPLPLVMKYEQKLRDLGLRHELDVFPGFDHLAFGYLDEWGPAREFLTNATVERSPPRVTYRAVPSTDNETFGLVHDKAYWVSDISVHADSEHGLVDVRSLAFGQAEPKPVDFEREGTKPAPHTKHGTTWKEPLVDPPAENAFDVSLSDVTSVTIWVEEADVDPDEPIELSVDATVPATIVLASSKDRLEVSVPAGETQRTVSFD